MTSEVNQENMRMGENILTFKETTPTEGINRSKLITEDHPTGCCVFSYNKSWNKLYQNKLLAHAKECFVETSNKNIAPSVIPPKTEPMDQDDLLLSTNGI